MAQSKTSNYVNYFDKQQQLQAEKNPDPFKHIASYQNSFERETDRSSDKNESR